ncbi:MAG: hypothetical protein HYT80_02830 [Euryarchaeota archaeon]|nr:hypothetical protein [Euryarchaeota archaeon]
MRSTVAVLVVVLLASSVAGCLEGGGAKDDPARAPRAKYGASVINLNASLLDTARFAADERFGPDRPLTIQDLSALLPKALTNYNVTLAYVLNMSLYPNVKAYQIGETLTGRAIFGLVLSDDGEFHPERPSIMFTCSQHGNEPSGSEACLILIEYFTHGTDKVAQDVRTRLNILVNPLANPDGKEGNRRGNYDEVDINRDHMNLATLEGRAIHAFYKMFNPMMTLDLHEFVCNRLPGGTGGCLPTGITFEAAGPEGAQNDPALFVGTNELLRHVLQRSTEKYGVGTSSYYLVAPTIPGTGQSGTSVGAYPSVHRHHFALRNSYSLLFETGGGAGLTNLARRVDHQLTATFASIEWFFTNQARALQVVADADRSAATRTPGIQGWVAPPQTNLPKLEHFLGMHGINFTKLDKDTTYGLVQDYRNNGAPAAKSFPNGTLVVNRWQADGRLILELFENTADTYYNRGPRAWPLEAYRVLQAP